MTGVATDRYTLYTATLNEGAGEIDLDQLTSINVKPNVQTADLQLPGTVDLVTRIITSADPTVTLETGDLYTLFPEFGLDVGNEYSDPAVFRFQQRESAGGTFAPAQARHEYVTSPHGGLAYIESLSVEQGNEDGAVANLIYKPYSDDGLNKPLIRSAAAVAIDSDPPPAYNSWYWPGTTWWQNVDGGTTLHQEMLGMIGWNIETGLNVSQRTFSGDVFAKQGNVSIVQRRPRIMLRMANMRVAERLRDAVANNMFLAPLDTPTAGDQATFSFKTFLQLGVSCGTRATGANSIRIHCLGACGEEDDITARENDDATSSVIITPLSATLAVTMASTMGVSG